MNNPAPPTNPKKDSGPSSQELSAKGWASRLTIVVVALLVVESITGLWIYLAPFSVGAQLQVLLHTVIGLIVLIPYLYYQTRHFLVWYRQNITVIMILGYALMAMTLICMVSGVVLTWQSLFAPRLSTTWDLVHLVTGILIAALVVLHLLKAYQRRRIAFQRIPEQQGALAGFVRQQMGWVGGLFSVVVLAALIWPVQPGEMPLPEGYTLPDYAQQFDEYRGSPFAPTYARTVNGALIRPSVLAGSESCGSAGCHVQILAEWEPSAHRFAAMNQPFQKVQKDFAEDRNPAETRYCAGCHDPISLFAGAKDIHNISLTSPGTREGISCASCHSISKVDQRGNADYEVTPPQKYLWEAEDGVRKLLSDFLIRSYPRQHLADYDRNLLRTAEFCGVCHKQFIPEALNRFGVSEGQNQYDEWRKSHWHVEDDAEKDLSCRDCHMRLVRDSEDPGRGEAGDLRRSADDGAHRHHGTIATNLFMPEVLKLPHWEEQVRLTREWMQGKTVIPEIEKLWPAGPLAKLDIQGPEEVETGQEVSLMVLVQNRKVGHNLTTGPLDFVRSWIHLQVTDEAGNMLAEFGSIDPVTRRINDLPGRSHEMGNSREKGTLVLEAMPIDEHGNELARHELWKKAGGKGKRVIFPGYTDKQVYRFTVPASVSGTITVKADFNFRRYRQEFLQLVLPTLEEETGVIQPTVVHGSVTKQIHVIPSAIEAKEKDPTLAQAS